MRSTQYFCGLVRRFPKVLDGLAEQVSDVSQLGFEVGKVADFFEAMTQREAIVFAKTDQQLDDKRVVYLCRKVGIPTSCGHFPRLIYLHYLNSLKNIWGNFQFCLPEIVSFIISGGTIPISNCFLFNGKVCYWDSDRKCLAYFFILSDTDDMITLVRRFLIDAKQVVSSLDEIFKSLGIFHDGNTGTDGVSC
jgi:hypothetical protein